VIHLFSFSYLWLVLSATHNPTASGDSIGTGLVDGRAIENRRCMPYQTSMWTLCLPPETLMSSTLCIRPAKYSNSHRTLFL
jgi:hypothetical protein